MNQINPLYLMALLMTILIFAGYQLEQAKEKQQQLHEKLSVIHQMGERTAVLKAHWENRSETQKRLQQLLNTTELYQSGIEVDFKAAAVSLSAKSANTSAVEYLINKVLNGTYTVTKLELKRLDGAHASLKLELAL